MVETSHHGTPFGDIRLRHWPAADSPGEAGNRDGKRAGTWPTVVLVHGMFGDVDVWSATALNLARAGLQVLAADLPGHGESTAEVDTAEQAAQAIGAALDAWQDASAQAEVMQDEGSSHRAEAAGLASPLASPASCRAREGGEALQDGQQLLLVGHSFGALVAKARKGADFGALAQENSEAGDAATGGSMGWRKADDLPGLFADTVRKLKPGEISAPVRSPAGFHILKLQDGRE